jgi:hypothetical protein
VSKHRTADACEGGSSAKRKADRKEESADQNKSEKNGQHAAGAERDLRILLRRGHKKVK